MLSLAKRAVVLGGQHASGLSALIPTDGLLAWWNAESGVWSDTGLTTPAVDGGAVAGWSDQSASGYHVTQAGATERPIYRASVTAFGNKPGVEFVSSDYLIRTGLSAPVIGNLNTYSVYAVFSTTAVANNGHMYGEGHNTLGNPRAGVRNNGAQAEGWHASDASVVANPPATGQNVATGVVRLLTFRRGTSNEFSIRLDGTQRGTSTAAPGTTSINQLALGAVPRTTPAATYLYYIGFLAQVLIYSADNFATIEPILKAHYGIA